MCWAARWCWRRSGRQSTQYYAKITPNTLTKAYTDAQYFSRNVRTIEVLVDRDAVTSGAAAAGEPWQHYDLGHGYCTYTYTYTFFEQRPHRMACARCDFYAPKDSAKAQLIEAKDNLQRMAAAIPLTDDERSAVDDGQEALDRLLDRLADTPTPAGPTPRELDVPASARLLPLVAVRQGGASAAPRGLRHDPSSPSRNSGSNFRRFSAMTPNFPCSHGLHATRGGTHVSKQVCGLMRRQDLQHFLGRAPVHLLRLAAATAAATALAISIPATANAAPTATERTATGVDIYESQQTDKQIRDFWTPMRMKEALEHPLDAPPTVAPERNRRTVTSPAEKQNLKASAKGVMPTTTTLKMNAASAAGSVSQEVPVTAGFNVVGKVFFTLPNGDPKVCSASSIVSNNKNTIWTAGHCVHKGDGSGNAGWMQNIKYVPGYRDGNAPVGEWTAARMHAASTWTGDGDSRESDMAAIVLNPVLVYGTLENAVGGAFGYTFAENATDYSNVAAVGYPMEGYKRTDLTGERMMHCAGNTTDASSFNPFDDRLKIDCDMGHGASGGPFIYGPQNDPRIVGAISHNEADATTGERINDDLFSSEHGANAAAVINAANGT